VEGLSAVEIEGRAPEKLMLLGKKAQQFHPKQSERPHRLHQVYRVDLSGGRGA